MRLTEIALAITLVLLAITAYMAYEGHKDRFTSDQEAGELALQRGGGTVEQRLASIERQMDGLRQDQIRQGGPARPVGQAGDPPSPPANPPDDALGTLIEDRGASPYPPSVIHREDEEPQLSELERQVLRAPTFAKVQVYDADYNVMQINVGSEGGVREGVEFSIRRGQYLLGTMRVTVVEEGASAGEMILNTMPDGLMVEPGDDVIQKIVPNN